MKTIKLFLGTGLLVGAFVIAGCKKEGCTDVNANNYDTKAKKNNNTCTYPVINTSSSGKSGDISGSGGTVSKTWTFTNSNSTAGWDMSINSSSGSFQMILKDASGTTMLDKTLTAGSGLQSTSGQTPAGTPGTWTAILTLTKFNGSGDYSFL